MLTEEKLDETDNTLEASPWKSFVRVAQALTTQIVQQE